MRYSYDPEAVYQDADVEMAEAAIIGNTIAALQKRGICCHNSAVSYRETPVYPEQEGLKPGQYRCTDGCGTVFGNEEDWIRAMSEVVEGY